MLFLLTRQGDKDLMADLVKRLGGKANDEAKLGSYPSQQGVVN